MKGRIMKDFTDSDLREGYGPTINTDAFRDDLVHAPLPWQRAGKQETTSGYGKRLNTGYKIKFNGRLYRVYCTQYSNAGSCWFTVKGRKIYVH